VYRGFTVSMMANADLHPAAASVRGMMATALDARFFTDRYGRLAWGRGERYLSSGRMPTTGPSYAFDICLYFHPVYSGLEHVDQMVMGVMKGTQGE
jgi:hypothetical protein